jgi:hypothetical protein
VGFTADGAFLCGGESDGTLTLWRRADWTLHAALPHEEGRSLFALRPGPTPGRVFFMRGDRPRMLRLGAAFATDPSAFESLSFPEAHGGRDAPALAVAGGRVFSGGYDGLLRRFNGETGAFEGLVRAGSPVMSLAASPDGRAVAGGLEDGSVIVWEGGSLEEIAREKRHEKDVYGVSFDPVHGQLASASAGDRSILVWERDKPGARRIACDLPIFALSFDPDGRRLAAAVGNEVVLFDAQGTRELRRLSGAGDVVSGLAFSPDGSLLAASSYDRTVRVWELETLH